MSNRRPGLGRIWPCCLNCGTCRSTRLMFMTWPMKRPPGPGVFAGLASSCHIQLIGGSIVRRHDGCLYNTTYIVDEEVNRVSSYDKCHLFTPGGEEKVFAPGDHLNTFFLGDIPMASITCYDLRFGEWVRMAALAGARILFVPAAWPHPRLAHWQILNRPGY